MFDRNSPAVPPMEALIVKALSIAPSALKALQALDIVDGRQRRIAYRLASHIDAGKMFADCDIDDLERLLRPTLDEIDQGWVREILTDECSMSGSWVNHRLTNEAAALQEAVAPLVALHCVLVRVQNLRKAERIADTLS